MPPWQCTLFWFFHFESLLKILSDIISGPRCTENPLKQNTSGIAYLYNYIFSHPDYTGRPGISPDLLKVAAYGLTTYRRSGNTPCPEDYFINLYLNYMHFSCRCQYQEQIATNWFCLKAVMQRFCSRKEAVQVAQSLNNPQAKVWLLAKCAARLGAIDRTSSERRLPGWQVRPRTPREQVLSLTTFLSRGREKGCALVLTASKPKTRNAEPLHLIISRNVFPNNLTLLYANQYIFKAKQGIRFQQ